MAKGNVILKLLALAQLFTFTLAIDCSVNLSTDIPKFEPVLLSRPDASSTYELFKPTGETTTLPVGSQLLLVCAGNNNEINLLHIGELELTCHSDGTLKNSASTTYQLTQLGCKSIPTSILQLTTVPCADNQGYIFKAGFVYGSSNFVPIFSVCYDSVTETTFYTHNVINGAAINYNIKESTRRAFRADGIKYTTTATNTLYTIANQKTRFEALFGSAQPYISDSMFLARGHLTPDADFVFSFEQLSTYFYVNVAPEFQIVNAGNWLRVENLARSVAAGLNDDLETYNGYMGLLELPHPSTSALVPIYIDTNGEFEAPLYYFKVLKHAATDAAIVLISLNNPFASAVEAQASVFCNNVCSTAGMAVPQFTDETRGYTFCCELSDFKTYYEDLPVSLTASNLLVQANGPTTTSTPAPIEEPEGCTIVMPTDIPNPEPVYILTETPSSSPQLFWPTGQVTEIPIGATLTLYCPGSSNELDLLGQQSIELTCQSDQTFYSVQKSQTYTLNQLNCKSIPTSDLLTTSNSCSNGQGYAFEAGFDYNGDFLSTFTICYDNSTEHTLYSRNIINGATQNYKINESTRRAFRALGMRFTTTATNNFYTNNNQKTRFEALFGLGQTYITTSSFLARGHLAPDADFVFGYEQLSTYFYTNCAPEWQVVNAGNWLRVENLARSLASGFGSDLLTFTSTLGLLQLPNSLNVLKPIYLDSGSLIEAPLWYYKILLHPELPVDLVLITLNNPFAQPADVVEFCTNVCDLYDVNVAAFTDLTKGYTFCCEFEDFSSVVTNLPTFDMPAGWSFKS